MEKLTGRAVLNLTWTWRDTTEGMSLYGSLVDYFFGCQVLDILQIGIIENKSCKCETQMKSSEQFQISMDLSVALLFLLPLIISCFYSEQLP